VEYEEGEILYLRANTEDSMPLTGEQIVAHFFRCIDSKDVDGILDLFDYNAIIYEPFSNITGGLKGKSSIESFLKVVIMASNNLQRRVKFENTSRPDRIKVLITFEKGGRVKSLFTFEFQDNEGNEKKIKSLRIEFL
jgi:hypothetical protein